MNYKSGDLVTITGNCNYHQFRIGETVRLKGKDGSDWMSESLKSGKCWWVRESDMKPFKPATMPQKIVVTTDGKTTLARLFDGKKMVKRAEAKCAPSDTFNFNTGANLAFNRLVYGTDYNPQDVAIKTNAAPADSKPEPVKLYGIKDDSGWVTKGKIYEFADGNIRFDEFYGGKRAYESFEKFKECNVGLSACLVPLVRRPAKVGEWIYIVDADPAFCNWYNGNYKNGDVMRITSLPPVDRRGSGVMSGKNYMVHSEYLVLDGYTGDPE